MQRTNPLEALAQPRKIRRRMPGKFDDEDLHPILRQIYAARQVTSAGDLDYRLETLIPPDQLPGIDNAVDILVDAVAAARIVFVGDFDADGATSTALGVLALRQMGADDVGYLVPNRFDFGYGLSVQIVDVAAQLQPDLLITVDNGISDVDGVERARELGISVIITDHHLPGKTLPAADAIVNPNLSNSAFASSALAGVGVIFYVMAALRARLRETGWFEGKAETNLADLLDLVALGTVADLVPLDKNNRVLVHKGLQRINAGRCRPGIKALLGYGNARPGEVCTSDLGFIVAPRLNAAGRLQDMSLGIECLLSDDHDKARTLAEKLDGLNRDRRSIESDMKSQAAQIIDHMNMTGELPVGVCLYDETWHQGVVGLIAGRVKDMLNRPVVAFARAGDDELKGSARSIPGLHIRDVLNGIHTSQPGLIVRFGGHAAAAGLSLRIQDYDRFATAFTDEVESRQHGLEDRDVVYSDGTLHEDHISLELARLLKSSGPWGQGFPEPVFDDEFEVLEHKTVGEHHLKMRVRKKKSRKVFDAIAFYQAVFGGTALDQGVRLLYRLDINEYNGLCKPQLVVQHIEPC